MTTAIVTWRANAATVLASVVTDPLSHRWAVDALRWCADAAKAVDAERKRTTAPMREALDAERARYAPALADLAAAEAHLRAQIAEYDQRLRASNFAAMTTGAAMVPRAHDARVRVVPKDEIEITDAALVPREYCVPDMALIRAAVKAGHTVPGVKVTRTVVTKLTGSR